MSSIISPIMDRSSKEEKFNEIEYSALRHLERLLKIVEYYLLIHMDGSFSGLY